MALLCFFIMFLLCFFPVFFFFFFTLKIALFGKKHFPQNKSLPSATYLIDSQQVQTLSYFLFFVRGKTLSIFLGGNIKSVFNTKMQLFLSVSGIS